MSEYTFERGRTLVLGELETALSAIELGWRRRVSL